MPAYNFQQQFAPQVENLSKRCTIRRPRKRPTVVGDNLMLFTGLRTKQCRLLLRTTCTAVKPIRILRPGTVYLAGCRLTNQEIKQLATDDGFASEKAFYEFFHKTYGLPATNFELISWAPEEPT